MEIQTERKISRKFFLWKAAEQIKVPFAPDELIITQALQAQSVMVKALQCAACVWANAIGGG